MQFYRKKIKIFCIPFIIILGIHFKAIALMFESKAFISAERNFLCFIETIAHIHNTCRMLLDPERSEGIYFILSFILKVYITSITYRKPNWSFQVPILICYGIMLVYLPLRKFLKRVVYFTYYKCVIRY